MAATAAVITVVVITVATTAVGGIITPPASASRMVTITRRTILAVAITHHRIRIMEGATMARRTTEAAVTLATITPQVMATVTATAILAGTITREDTSAGIFEQVVSKC